MRCGRSTNFVGYIKLKCRVKIQNRLSAASQVAQPDVRFQRRVWVKSAKLAQSASLWAWYLSQRKVGFEN